MTASASSGLRMDGHIPAHTPSAARYAYIRVVPLDLRRQDRPQSASCTLATPCWIPHTCRCRLLRPGCTKDKYSLYDCQALTHGEFTSILKPFLSHREGMREVPCMYACIWASGDEVARIAKADHHSPLAISISHSLYLYEYMLLPLLLFHATRTNNCSHSRRTCRIDPVLC